jgi:hypothetical protein
MAEEQSSLRTAIDQIMGWPAGGGQQGAGGTTSSPGFGPAPAPSGPVNLGTVSNVANAVPEAVADPFEAQLAEIRAQNDALAASLASTATPAAPVEAAPAAAVVSKEPAMISRADLYNLRGQNQVDFYNTALAKSGSTSGKPASWTPYTFKDPYMQGMVVNPYEPT